MAIILAYNALVVRKAEIENRYQGGLAQFRNDWMSKQWWCEDEHLCAFSSMGAFRKGFIDQLKVDGIDFLAVSESVPPAEIVTRCGWLDWCVHEKRERRDSKGNLLLVQEIPKHWLKGSEPGDVALWSFQKRTAAAAKQPLP